ncbi:MAG: hypothetical protein LC114_21190 [Bryobacterales bacterium]|nr:hypothetical protein [Bryobacterales bacterium]
MPSSKSTMEGLIERFESLLSPLDGRGSASSYLNGGVGGVAGGLLTSGESRSVLDSLSDGLLGGGTGLLAGILRSLFGGRDRTDPEPVLYERPEPLFFEYDVSPAPRGAVNLPAGGLVGTNDMPVLAQRGGSGTVSPSVIVQVNALDAQSFSARSDDIASAVREALARNHALRDEIWED